MIRSDVERLVQVEKDIVSAREALKLQADANNKHFSDLNGEAGRLRQMQDTYLPREVWDQAIKTIIGTLIGLVVSVVLLIIRLMLIGAK